MFKKSSVNEFCMSNHISYFNALGLKVGYLLLKKMFSDKWLIVVRIKIGLFMDRNACPKKGFLQLLLQKHLFTWLICFQFFKHFVKHFRMTLNFEYTQMFCLQQNLLCYLLMELLLSHLDLQKN